MHRHGAKRLLRLGMLATALLLGALGAVVLFSSHAAAAGLVSPPVSPPVTTVTAPVARSAAAATGSVTSTVSKTTGSTTSAASTVTKPATSTVNTVTGSATSTVNSVTQPVTTTAGNVTRSASSTVNSTTSTVTTTVGNVTRSATSTANSTAATVTKTVGNLVGSAASTVNTVTPPVRRIAARVTAPTRSATPARTHSPAAIRLPVVTGVKAATSRAPVVSLRPATPPQPIEAAAVTGANRGSSDSLSAHVTQPMRRPAIRSITIKQIEHPVVHPQAARHSQATIHSQVSGHSDEQPVVKRHTSAAAIAAVPGTRPAAGHFTTVNRKSYKPAPQARWTVHSSSDALLPLGPLSGSGAGLGAPALSFSAPGSVSAVFPLSAFTPTSQSTLERLSLLAARDNYPTVPVPPG